MMTQPIAKNAAETIMDHGVEATGMGEGTVEGNHT